MISKMQKEYLETRLKTVIREKLDEYDKENPSFRLEVEEVYNLIQKKKNKTEKP